MVKATLHDDCSSTYASRADQYKPVAAAVEGDCEYPSEPLPWVLGQDGLVPVVPGQPLPQGPIMEIWLRRGDGYTEDGAPKYAWQWAVTSRAIVYEERDEHDAQAGHTLVKARVVMPYLGTGTIESEGGPVGYTEDGTPYLADGEATTEGGTIAYDSDGVPMLVPYGDGVGEFSMHETMAVRNVTTGHWYNVTSYEKIDDRLEIQMQRTDED